MSEQNTVQHEVAPIYQCDSKVHHTLRSVHDHLHQLCHKHAHKLVKVETMDGDVFEGHVIHCDKGILYICLSNEGAGGRAFFPGPFGPYYNNVLPLVLFNLLTISLLR